MARAYWKSKEAFGRYTTALPICANNDSLEGNTLKVFPKESLRCDRGFCFAFVTSKKNLFELTHFLLTLPGKAAGCLICLHY